MEKTLLTKVVTQLVNERANAQEYGVALVNIPDFDYVAFALGLSSERKAALFFLGFPESTRARIESELSQNERLSYDFTVEKAEESRNSGDESIFRVLVIKRAEMEKMSSLRWFPEITLERIYTKSCDLAKKDLAGTNAVIEALIQALRSKPIRSILSFERVLEYLELLISSPADTLPDAIKENYYRLGLCADKNVDSRNPVRDDFVARIKHNHGIVERISNLEQAERQSITNYYTKATGKKETPHRILSYYKTKDIALLGQMELAEVEECLKAAKEKKSPTPSPRRGTAIRPTALAAQLIFDDNQDQIPDILAQLERDIDQRANTKKAEKVEVDVDGGRAQFKTEPVTERIAEEMSSDSDFGSIIRAEVQAPDEAIRDLDKYERISLGPAILDPIWDSLSRISALVSEGETISARLKRFLEARKELLPFSRRLQDAPMLIIFDPNEVKIETAQNNRQIHIHPLCVPKVYKYNPIDEKVEIRPASEGGIFTVYASIIEKLNEHPSTFSHTSTSFYTPLKRETYDAFLDKCDWLVILDQSLKSWDISLRAASEKLFYRENDYRSIGIYSSNCRKFVLGYDTLVKRLGNFVPKEEGVKEIIKAVREINDDGLLSIVSHTSNRIFDTNHGKGSLGIALAAIHYKRQHPAAILVGLDTQLAQEWLSDREDGKLPDLIGINLESDTDARVDIIEVKTYADNPNAFTIDGDTISGHAVEQVTALESLTQEMLGKAEKITTISRREILREQVFECLFQATLDPASKLRYSNMLNDLFAGEYNVSVRRNIAFVDFENTESSEKVYKGIDDFLGKDYTLITIGSSEVQAILANTVFACEAGPLNPAFQDEAVASPQATYEANVVGPVQEETAWPEHSPVAPDTAHAYVADAPSTPVAPAAPVTNETDTELQRTDLREKCARINKVFRDYGINAYPVDPNMVQEAARFTRFSVELKSGETIRTLERFKTDIGIQLEANGEILIDHIKGTKYLSVDVPFAGAGKAISLLKHLNLLDGSSGALDFVAGQKADGRFEVVDIAKAPHMLIAGTTGSGKTIFLYSIIVSLLHKYPMEDLEFLIIDPKQTDFVFFEDLPNLYGGHVVVDAEEALEMIQRINDVDKEGRMQQLRFCRSRDIGSYNEKNPDHRMKRLIIIIDEYADLIQTAEMQGKRKEFEKFLSMLAQKVRSLGIHLIIATQRPSANIVTGVLKANIPYRISFRLPSHTDSQTILDMPGAENLLGKGDMLMVTDSDTIRMQGLYISEDELDNFVKSRQ